MSCDPLFLLDQSKAHPDEIRTCLVDHRGDCTVLLFRQRTKGRAVGSHTGRSRVPRSEPARHFFRHALLAAVIEVSPTLFHATRDAIKLKNRAVIAVDAKAPEPT